jgi:hypothetical protein
VSEPFPQDVLELFEREQEVRIETSRRDGTTKRRIIWIVVDEGEVFVRSVRGERGRWYRHLLERPVAAVHVAGRRTEVKAERADDAASIERCSRALEQKYAGDPSLRSMLVPAVLPTTLRLVPA